MAIYKEISPEQIKTAKSFLNQLVDVVQEDISGSNTRRKYQVFVTGGVGPGVTSSLFQTVYDQDFSLSTANPIFDMTVGLYESGSTVTDAQTGIDSAGKVRFPSQSLIINKPAQMYDGTLPTGVDEVKQYYLYQDNTVGIDGVANSGIYYFDTEDFVEGHKRWGMIFAEGYNSSAAVYSLIADEQTYSS